MDIIGKISIKRNKKENRKKTILTVGLVALVITIIIELILGNFASFAAIVPFIYLLNLRNKMGNKVLLKDVVISIDSKGDQECLEVSNCEYRDRALYSVRLIITDCNAVNIIYNQLDKRIVINCVAKKELFLGNTIIPSYDEKPCSIELFVTNTDAERIANAFRTSLYYTS